MFRYTKATVVREAVLWCVTALWLVPFYFLVATTVKSDFSSFTDVLTSDNDVGRALMNSVVVTVGSIAGLVLLGSLCAYVVARRTSAWSRVTFYAVLVAILLPTQLGTLPLYVGARSLGLVGSVWGLIILWIGVLLPFAVFLYSVFLRGLGTELEEAAVLDGASPTQVFFRIVLSLARPSTGAVAILTGMIVWNDFFTSLIFLSGSGAQTIPVSMYYYVGGTVTEWDKIFAIVILSMLPVLVLYVFAQKHFMQSYSSGLKG